MPERVAFLHKILRYPYFAWERMRYPELFSDPTLVRVFNYSPAIIRFCKDMQKKNLLLDCPLNEKSVVWDVGGFNGEWAECIIQKYHPRMYIFEPNPNLFSFMSEKMSRYDNVQLFSYGLSDEDENVELAIRGPGSSTVASSPSHHSAKAKKKVVSLRDVCEVFEELGLPQVDLMKINIEGGEYKVLQRMADTDLFQICKYIRVQFHEWYPGSQGCRKKIRKVLSRSHRIEWDYPFVWESWIRKDA